MGISILKNKSTAAVVLLTVAIAIVALVLILTSRPPNGRAEAASALGTPPSTPVVPASTVAQLTQFRDSLLSKPLAIPADLAQRIVSGQLDGLAGGPLTASQRTIISDGYITLDEYRTAQTAWHTCMQEAGFSMPPMHLDGFGRYNDDIVTGAGDPSAMLAAMHTCQAKYTGAINLVWAQVTGPLQQKVAEVQQSSAYNCVAAAGYSVADVPNGSDAAANTAYTRCMTAVESATDTVVFLRPGTN